MDSTDRKTYVDPVSLHRGLMLERNGLDDDSICTWRGYEGVSYDCLADMHLARWTTSLKFGEDTNQM